MWWLLLITSPSVPLTLIMYILYFDTNKEKIIMKDEEVKTNLAEFWKGWKKLWTKPTKKATKNKQNTTSEKQS